MATPPTRVLNVTPAVGWSSTASPKTSPTFDVQSGDLLTFMAFAENGNGTVAAPTWTGSGAWTLRQSIELGGQWCSAYIYTCTVTATAAGRTVSAAGSGPVGQFSFIVSVWRNHGGVGISDKANTSGAPSLALTLAANSAAIVGNSDWNAADGASRTWRTVNGSPLIESSYGGTVGSTYVVYTGYTLDAGAAGSETLGLSVPSGQKYSIVGIEILGKAVVASFSGTAAFLGTGTVTASGAPRLSGAIAMSGSGALAVAGASQLVGQGVFLGSGALAAVGSAHLTGTAVLSGIGAMSTVGTPHAGGTAILTGSGTFSSVGAPSTGGTAIFTGTGSMGAVGTPTLSGAALLTGAGTLAAGGAGSSAASGTVLLGGTGALSASGAPRLAGVASLASTGILVTVGSMYVAGATHFVGLGTLSVGSGTSQLHGALAATLAPRTFMATLRAERLVAHLRPNRWAGRLR